MAKIVPKVIMALLVLALTVYSVSAVGTNAEQSYNKVFLDPFYRESMDDDTNYEFTVVFEPEDGVSSVVSSIVTFDMWITPTVVFTLTVEGQSCNNPVYEIHTTYAGSGRGVATFDCSNIIDGAGTYHMNLSSSKDTGSVTSWLDITYMNKPKGSLDVHGTEYIPGEMAKSFLQFLDDDKQIVNDSTCFLSVYYPNSTMWLEDLVMTYAGNGLYYRNVLLPENETGVYMNSAKCYQPLALSTYEEFIAYDDFESNSWIGGTGWSQPEWDYSATAAEISSAESIDDYSALITGAYGYIGRGFQSDVNAESVTVDFWYFVHGWQGTEQMDLWIFGGAWGLISSWTKDNVVQDQWTHESYTVSSDRTDYGVFGNMRISFDGYYMPSAGDHFYVDNITITQTLPNITITNETGYQILRGSGEMHVSELYDSLSGGGGGLIDLITDIWNWVQDLLGITQDTQQLVSGDVEMVDAKAAIDGTGYATTFLTYADDEVDVNATCYVDIWYPNSTQWVDGQQMNATGSDGRYIYSISQPNTDGLYQMRSFCNGTSLMNRTRYAYANLEVYLEVYNDVRMEMIS